MAAEAPPEDERVSEEEASVWAWSWGAGTDGQLGTGGFQDHHLPQPLLFPPRCRGRVSCVAGGGAHVIALTSDGEIYTWGRGTHGQLGHGNFDNSPYPKFVKFFENQTVTSVSAGWNHSGFTTDSGQVFMCGDGSFGQLGTGDNHSKSLPFEVAYFNLRHVEKLACGMRHSLVLLKDNSVYGFGSARRGQIGRCVSRSHKSYNVPRLIDGFPNCKVVNIYANGDHSAALNESGRLYIWGRALTGEHDDEQPRVVLLSLNISQVTLGWHHALLLSGICALCLFSIELYFLEMFSHLLHYCIEGQIFTIGVFRHQKCDLPESGNAVVQQSETIASSSTHDETSSLSALEKVPCIDGEHVVQIASGTEHSALVTDKGTVFTWGWGEHGQLGLGDTSDQVVPQRVNLGGKWPPASGSLGIYCGSGFTIAVQSA